MKRLAFLALVVLAACTTRKSPGPDWEALERKGKGAIPEVRALMASEDAGTSRRALELMAKITGMWGSDGGILWKRSLDEARVESAGTGKPILLLHLFGKLDEEFC